MIGELFAYALTIAGLVLVIVSSSSMRARGLSRLRAFDSASVAKALRGRK